MTSPFTTPSTITTIKLIDCLGVSIHNKIKVGISDSSAIVIVDCFRNAVYIYNSVKCNYNHEASSENPPSSKKMFVSQFFA